MELKVTELSGHQKLIVDAAGKMLEAKRAFEQAELEFINLTSERKSGKTIAHRTLRADAFNLETRTSDEILNQATAIIQTDGGISSTKLRGKLNIGVREIARVTDQLVADGRIEYVDNGGNSKYWRIKGSKLVPARKSTKGRRHGGMVDITTDEWKDKMLKFLQSHTWVTKRMMVAHFKTSGDLLNRWLKHLQKQKLITSTWKKNNPNHKSPNVHAKTNLYWEAV